MSSGLGDDRALQRDASGSWRWTRVTGRAEGGGAVSRRRQARQGQCVDPPEDGMTDSEACACGAR